MLFSAVLNVLMLTSSVYMLQVYDRVLTSGSIETLLYLTIIAVAALLLLSLLDTLRSRMLDRVSNWLEMSVSPIAFRRALDAVSANVITRVKACGIWELSAHSSAPGSPPCSMCPGSRSISAWSISCTP